jgi:pre-mRNA-splicing helicase BRR2
MNKVRYEKLLDQAGKSQTLVFVHSRKETAKMARFIKRRQSSSLSDPTLLHERLTEEAGNVKDRNLRDLLFGFVVHHAGMSREDRTLVEELFTDGSVQVLVCAVTLPWGVNLPAARKIL